MPTEVFDVGRCRSARRQSRIPVTLVAAAMIATSLAAQRIALPSRGSAYALSRGPTLSFSVLRAADGTNVERLRLDDKTPETKVTRIQHKTHVAYVMRGKLATEHHGTIEVDAELEVYPIRNGSRPASEVNARITRLPEALGVHSLGIELEFEDAPGRQSLLVPVFSGGEFQDPHSIIPIDEALDTGNASSVQATAYYGADGSGLAIYCLDERGVEPKRFRYEVRSGSPKKLGILCEYFLPNSDVGGEVREMPRRIRVDSFGFDPRLHEGWFVAAKRYRAWLESAARGRDGLLEKGRLVSRTDVPRWMRELDLLVTEQFQWYPELTKVSQPLRSLERLKHDLGARDVLLALWSWENRKSEWGRAGTYFPLPSTVEQIRALEKAGIRTLAYTNPTAFDARNPVLGLFPLASAVLHDRDGRLVTEVTGVDYLNQPLVTLFMDPASTILHQWYFILGWYHSLASGLSGFYADAPVTAAFSDFRRQGGQERGTSELGLLGFRSILRSMQQGAQLAGSDFVTFHEASFEWLVPAASAGQGAVGLVSRPYRDEPRAHGVPFFQTIYSGYTLFWPADEGLGSQTLVFVPNAYGPLEQNNMSRLLAEGFTLGHLINVSELALPEGKLSYEIENPKDLAKNFAHHKRLVKALIELRRVARRWLVYGELLASPVVGGDRIKMVVKRPFGTSFVDQSFDKLAVPTTAWRASDGSIRIVCANGTATAAKVRLDLRRLGLSEVEELVDVVSNESFEAESERYVTVDVPPARGRLLRVVVDD